VGAESGAQDPGIILQVSVSMCAFALQLDLLNSQHKSSARGHLDKARSCMLLKTDCALVPQQLHVPIRTAVYTRFGNSPCSQHILERLTCKHIFSTRIDIMSPTVQSGMSSRVGLRSCLSFHDALSQPECRCSPPVGNPNPSAQLQDAQSGSVYPEWGQDESQGPLRCRRVTIE
jgi:hypothetical protein